MRTLRTETPQSEMWDVADIMSYLGCDKQKAKDVMQEFRDKQGKGGYGAIEKHLILDFINEKQREEREREARYNADLATARQVAVLENQVKTLKEQTDALKLMCDASSDDARKARTQSLVANFIAGISVVVAVIALVLKLY